MERANFLLRQAFEEDEQGNEKDAIELYLNAAEMCIEAVSNNNNGLLTYQLNGVKLPFYYWTISTKGATGGGSCSALTVLVY